MRRRACVGQTARSRPSAEEFRECAYRDSGEAGLWVPSSCMDRSEGGAFQVVRRQEKRKIR
jgi:hypothetical protein